MPLKDYYKTLEVPSTATIQDIKKAYRALAHKYHPDKAQDSPFANNHFREIQEAYSILSDEAKRKSYDEERYFAGLSLQKEPERITSEWVLRQAKKLSHHMAQVDSYRMNHQALYDYTMLLLSDEHLAVLQEEHYDEINKRIIEELLYAIKNIGNPFFINITQRLYQVARENDELCNMIFEAEKKHRKTSAEQKYLPFFVILIAIILCIIMYLYSKRAL